MWSTLSYRRFFSQAVSFEEGEALAKEFKIPFMETSAFNDINVEEAFMRITKDVYSRIESGGGVIPASNGKAGPKPKAGAAGPKAISSEDFEAPPAKKRGFCSLV